MLKKKSNDTNIFMMMVHYLYKCICCTYVLVLDISFNRITKIENLSNLLNLKKLFLINNKITKIENLDALENLEMLELGSNRIRVIENLEGLKNLTNLFLGKNKISKIENLGSLENLELLSLQVIFYFEY
ncbi:UNVERIFIED_CONTAM: Ppp1r7 [Trichonephila clavipes]